MVGFEERLREGLHDLAEVQGVPEGFDDRVGAHAARLRRNGVVLRASAVGACVVALVAMAGWATVWRADQGVVADDRGDITVGEWTDLARPTGVHPIGAEPVVVDGGRVVLVDEWESGDERRFSGAVLDARDLRWTSVPPSASAPHVMAWDVVAAGDEVIALHDAFPVRASALDVGSRTWRELADLPGSLLPRASAWSGEELVVVGTAGSRSGDAALDTAAASYDPALDRWELIPPPPASLGNVHLAAWTGTEAVFVGSRGGVSGRQSVMDPQVVLAFDPETRGWRTLTLELGEGWTDVAVALTPHGLFVGGGMSVDLAAPGGAFRERSWFVDLATGAVTEAPAAPAGFLSRARGMGAVWTGEAVLVVGWTGRPYLLDGPTGSWRSGAHFDPEEVTALGLNWVWDGSMLIALEPRRTAAYRPPSLSASGS